MFTGIVEELGIIRHITSRQIEIECAKVLEQTKIGDSIAVNGVCLTVIELKKSSFAADISHETYMVTSFSQLKNGDTVNLERALLAEGRFGGHVISGHIDGTGKCTGIKNMNDFWEYEFELAPESAGYVVKKGSVAVNGISLTVADIAGNKIKIAVIPHTYANTNLKTLEINSFVNIETDLFAKYIEKFLSTENNKSGIDVSFLQENGFLV